MARSSKRRLLPIILSVLGVVIFLVALIGATYGRGFMALVGRDKDFIRAEILAVHNDKKKDTMLAEHASKLESKLGKFESISHIMGHASVADVTSGKAEYSYYAYCDFEKGEGTYFVRISNETDTPKLLSVTSEPGHMKRKRVRQAIMDQVR